MGSFIPIAQPSITKAEIASVVEAMEEGWVSSQGPVVSRFERSFAALQGVDSAVACSSGTTALHLALLDAGVGPGMEVVLPDLTFAASASAVIHAGAVPVLVDVDESLCINHDLAKAAITPRTKAMITVDLFGMESGTRYLRRMCDDHGIALIEDRAENLNPDKGLVGHYACFSFFANKEITTGEGGMVIGGDDGNIRRWMNHGTVKPYFVDRAGYNYRMTSLQAALGIAQIGRIGELKRARLHCIERYMKAGLGGNGLWLYVIMADDAEDFMAFMKKKMIDTRPMFTPLHRQEPFEQKGFYPVSDAAWRMGVCLPTGGHLSEHDLDYIIGAIDEYKGGRNAEQGLHRLRPTTSP